MEMKLTFLAGNVTTSCGQTRATMCNALRPTRTLSLAADCALSDCEILNPFNFERWNYLHHGNTRRTSENQVDSLTQKVQLRSSLRRMPDVLPFARPPPYAASQEPNSEVGRRQASSLPNRTRRGLRRFLSNNSFISLIQTATVNGVVVAALIHRVSSRAPFQFVAAASRGSLPASASVVRISPRSRVRRSVDPLLPSMPLPSNCRSISAPPVTLSNRPKASRTLAARTRRRCPISRPVPPFDLASIPLSIRRPMAVLSALPSSRCFSFNLVAVPIGQLSLFHPSPATSRHTDEDGFDVDGGFVGVLFACRFP